MQMPRISVVIRTLDAGTTLPSVLNGLDLQSGDELIIIDSGSTDQSVEIAREHSARILQIPKASFTYGGALNQGFGAATNPWILSLSSNCVPANRGFLAEYRKAVRLVDDSATVLAGPILGEFENPIKRGLTLYRKGDLEHGFGFYAGNPNCLYRAASWKARPFDVDQGPGEDYRWYFAALEAGETIVGVHDAEVRYISRRSARAFFNKGRQEYRAANQLFAAYQPNLKGLVVRLVKVGVFWLIGRMNFHTAKGSFIHYLGMLVEARSQRRGSTISQ